MAVLAVEKYHALLKYYRTGLRLREDNVKKAIACIWEPSVLICLPATLALDAVAWFVQLSIIIYCYGSLTRGLYFSNTVCRDTDVERRSEKKKLVITFILTPTLVSYVIIPSGDGTTDVSFYAQLTTVADFVFVVSLCFNPFI
ncbi:unnamed protein product [Porites lobata]|uniref:G-protein coupled receptors family 1 profile domain-containing protein n=1 Tax=Porites lobata TaxID=104759 RepID=A0ABN8QLA2_9CNID|nr:unnamed protein product [Porites lobata]